MLEPCSCRCCLTSYGYEKAEKLGLLPEYLALMNEGGSGGYPDAVISEAKSRAPALRAAWIAELEESGGITDGVYTKNR